MRELYYIIGMLKEKRIRHKRTGITATVSYENGYQLSYCIKLDNGEEQFWSNTLLRNEWEFEEEELEPWTGWPIEKLREIFSWDINRNEQTEF
jgi:hypothetical protein